MKVTIWHNIMWSRYKAAVFSALQALSLERQINIKVYQIAETANQRKSLSPTDMSGHKYPHELLFDGAYERIPRLSLLAKVARKTWIDDTDVTILAGYDRPEYWLQAAILLLRGRTFACFCDSTVYDNKQRFFAGLLKRIFFKWCSGIFCYGQRAAEYVSLYGATPDKIIHRCQAAALYDEYTPERALQQRASMYAASSSPRFLYVGRLSREKSIDHLILAFNRLKERLPTADLIVIGGGPEETRLKELSHRLGLENTVKFAGAKSGGELFSEYLKATCLILPSYSEPWGLVVNEALSHGCPVIVSQRCGCVPELVREGSTGFSFAWGEIDDLASKMESAARFHDPQEISQNCLRQIAPFTPESAARSILDGSIILSKSGRLH